MIIPHFSYLPIPGLRQVTRIVRHYNHVWDGPGAICMYWQPPTQYHAPGWVIEIVGPDTPPGTYSEILPGDDAKIDAVAVARRLIANVKVPS